MTKYSLSPEVMKINEAHFFGRNINGECLFVFGRKNPEKDDVSAYIL